MNNYKPPYTITSKMLTLVSEIVELMTEINIAEKSLITPKLRKENMVKSITGSLQIEGNSFSEEKVTAILDGKRVLGSVQEISEVEGAIKAYNNINNYKYDELNDLLKAHKLMMSGLLTNAGKLRSGNVGIYGKEGVSHIAPPADRVPYLMDDLFDWLKNSKDHKLITSAVFHYEFEFIHPFSDGNGRISRLWQTVILKSYKELFSFIPIESVVKNNQKEYYNSLANADKTGQSTIFVEFMLKMILKTLKETENSVPKKVPRNVPKKRAEEILGLMQKDVKITIAEIANILKVSDKTIKRDIEKLKANNLLKRVGSLKSGHWELVNEL